MKSNERAGLSCSLPSFGRSQLSVALANGIFDFEKSSSAVKDSSNIWPRSIDTYRYLVYANGAFR